VAHVGVPSHKLESASNRHTDGQTPLPICIDAGLKVSVAPQNIEHELRRQPGRLFDGVRVSSLHGVERQGSATAEHGVLVPAAPGVRSRWQGNREHFALPPHFR
jgi:hypothetical protein